MDNTTQIKTGFSDGQRTKAAELYDAAFGAKLRIAIPDNAARLAILRDGFNPKFAIVALSQGELVGIAGFKTGQGSLTGGIGFGLLKRELGWIGAVRAILVLLLFEREYSPGQLLMDGISVSPKMRGSGIGSKLLHRVIAYAQEQGFGSVRLDVIDTNPAAKRLYERVGFTVVDVDNFPYLKFLLGFSASVQMQYKIIN